MFGYKAFRNGLKNCDDYDFDKYNENFQYDVDVVYDVSGELNFNENGFIFFELPIDMLNYFIDDFINYCDFALIEILGDVKHEDYHWYSITNKFKIIKTLSKDQLFDLFKDGCNVTASGNQVYFKDKKVHRDDDEPAIIRINGDKEWRINGIICRYNDKPAIEYADGTHQWFIDGMIDRENDKPASIKANGSAIWFKKGQIHRDRDKPAIIDSDGVLWWYTHGLLNRTNNMPACVDTRSRFEIDGIRRSWYLDGKYVHKNVKIIIT